MLVLNRCPVESIILEVEVSEPMPSDCHVAWEDWS